MPEGQDLEGLGLYVGTTSPASSLSDFVPCVLKYLCKDVDHRLMEALLMIVKGWKHLVMVQPLSHVRLFTSPWTAAHQASLSFTISWSLLKLMPFVSDAIQASHPLLTPSPPAFYLSQHQGLF